MSRRWEKFCGGLAYRLIEAGGRKGYERRFEAGGRGDGQTPVTPCCSWPHVPGRGRDEGGDDRAKSSRCKKPISSCFDRKLGIFRWNGSGGGVGPRGLGVLRLRLALVRVT